MDTTTTTQASDPRNQALKHLAELAAIKTEWSLNAFMAAREALRVVGFEFSWAELSHATEAAIDKWQNENPLED